MKEEKTEKGWILCTRRAKTMSHLGVLTSFSLVWLYFVKLSSWTTARPVSCFSSCVRASPLSMNSISSYKNRLASHNAVNYCRLLHWQQRWHFLLFLKEIYEISTKRGEILCCFIWLLCTFARIYHRSRSLCPMNPPPPPPPPGWS